jgi:hypothetical protein
MMKALDRRIILFAFTVSSGSALFIIYAKYGYIQVSLIIMTSSDSAVFPMPGLPAPEPVVGCWPCSSVVDVLLFFYCSLHDFFLKDSWWYGQALGPDIC